MRRKLSNVILGYVLIAAACSDDESTGRGPKSGGGTNSESSESAQASSEKLYVLGSVVINPDDERTTYVQTIDSIADGTYNNKNAIEIPGNGVLLTHGKNFFAGHTEEPTWTRYSVGEDGAIEESGSLSLLATGATSIDFGNAIVDDETAISVLSEELVAIVWNPETMEITGEIDLKELARDGYELEVWTTIAHDGLVYIPGRWSDWDGERIYPTVSLTVLDPKQMKVLGTAQDDRCASGGRVVFDKEGWGYVMGDGRTYSLQMFANAKGEKAPENCLLRIAPGKTEFDKDYFYTIPSLTGGIDSISELDTPEQGSGVGYAKMFYPDELPEDVKPVDFEFWSLPVHKMWQIELADPPTAKVVDGAPFAAIGFDGHALNGRYYSGESFDEGATSEVYEIDPKTNAASARFHMVGYFYGLYELER